MKPLLFVLALATACSNPVEPRLFARRVPEWKESNVSLPAQCLKARDQTQCWIKFTAAFIVTFTVPLSCTTVAGCIGGMVGMGMAWNSWYSENARRIDRPLQPGDDGYIP